MRYLSICSGIEAATVAWCPLGWKAAGFAEIAKFPSAVLKHHYPDVPNFGDFTRINADDVGSIGLLVGGTPCQDFSIAGLRAGLGGDRGNLALEFFRLADRLRPRWLVWENVPGVLSQNGGRDFGAILGALVELRYGFAYRVLDAQYFGLAQRRKRVFVIGYLGDWRCAAAVLFEREGLSWNPSPRSKAWQDSAQTLAGGARKRGGYSYDDIPLAGALAASTGGADENDAADGRLIAYGGNNTAGPIDVATAVNAKGGTGRSDFETETFIAHTLRGEGFDASEDGSGRGIPLVPAVAYRTTGNDGAYELGDLAGCLNTGTDRAAQVIAQAVSLRGRKGGATAELGGETMPALRTGGGGGDKPHALAGTSVRRLTPRECERLQGFADDYTAIRYRGKPTADGPRYQVLGNTMAVPVMKWIGRRISAVQALR